MPKIAYIRKSFRGNAVRTIHLANEILEDYAAQGYRLTLRQLYYQFVQKGLIANKLSEYKRLGNIVNDARLAGYIDWNHIEDRTRNLESLAHWDSPSHIVDAVSK
ncbi:MAG TPA: hypothetical protein VJ837_06180, partial [Candidatus Paceibacterota bacterium]|nr:hypothetical protein [Candidatus Paceibacterota bacterium]